MDRRDLASAALDRVLWPFFVGAPVALAILLLDHGWSGFVVTPIVTGALAGAIALAERIRPERPEHVQLDRPLFHEIAHFVLGLELGYGIALGASELVSRGLRATIPPALLPTWPASWPLPLQLLAALLFYEGTSYWQHRVYHRVPALWRFHALHHSGARLNVVRTVRFHAIDFAAAAFVAYLPLVFLGAPDRFFTILGVLLSALGLLQHANLRLRTPQWLDWLVCTPAVHRRHHSIAIGESDTNFGNTVMIFDVLFGTWGRPRDPAGPSRIGIEHDPIAPDLTGQLLGPFAPQLTADTDIGPSTQRR